MASGASPDDNNNNMNVCDNGLSLVVCAECQRLHCQFRCEVMVTSGDQVSASDTCRYSITWEEFFGRSKPSQP